MMKKLALGLLCVVAPLQIGATASQSTPWRIAYDFCVPVMGDYGVYEPYCEVAIADDAGDPIVLMAGVQPSWSPDGLRVATGNGDVLVFNLADRTVVNLTNGRGWWHGPARWSPDNNTIAATSTSDGVLEIYTMKADGSAHTRLTYDAGVRGEFAWSPDGTAIAFTGTVDGVAELFVMQADGSNLRRLTYDAGVDTGFFARVPSAPSWAHDGTRIAFDCANDICAVNVDGSNLTRLTTGAFGAVFSPVDGRIAFVMGEYGSGGIAVMASDGSITQVSGFRAKHPAWSPTGESLALVSVVEGYDCASDGSCFEEMYDEIYTVNSDGTGLRRFVSGHSPRWAPSLPGQPVANLTHDCVSVACQFDATASYDPNGSIATYLWKFGDGTTSAEAAPSHTYATGGYYSVTLIVTDADGLTSVALKNVNANTAPIASFTMSCSGPACTLDGSASSDSDGTITTYRWIFGDGRWVDGGATATHTYPTGTFTATLHVIDDAGAWGSAEQTVTIVNALPVASFTVTCRDLTCTFDGSASSDEDGSIAWNIWNFDVTTASVYTRIATHTYPKAGTYTVTLIVGDDADQRAEASQTITVGEPPPPPTSYMHVGDLDGSSTSVVKGSWSAFVTVQVHDDKHLAVSGATLGGFWHDNTSASCTTDGTGRCVFARSNLPRRVTTATLTLTYATHATLVYASGSNHDPESDSNGTAIKVTRH